MESKRDVDDQLTQFEKDEMREIETIETQCCISIIIEGQLETLQAIVIKNVKALFGVFDTNGDRWISIDELGHGLRELGFTMTHRELRTSAAEIDKNKNGRIEYEEFRDFMLKQYRQLNKRSNKDRQVRQAFRMFDKDDNGNIDKNELKQAMTSLGERLSVNEIQTMLKEADENEDGRIDYEEFLKMWNMKYPEMN